MMSMGEASLCGSHLYISNWALTAAIAFEMSAAIQASILNDVLTH